MQSGIRIYPEPSDAILEKDAIMAPMGHHAYISIHKSLLSQNRWYCLLDFQLPKLALFDRYRMSRCIVECLWNKTAEICGCVEVNTLQQMYKFYGNVCEPLDFTRCLANRPNFAYETVGKCSIECKPECEMITYELRQTSAEIKQILTLSLKKMFNIDPKIHVRVDIFFPSIGYTHIEESYKITIDSIISDFGGQVRQTFHGFCF